MIDFSKKKKKRYKKGEQNEKRKDFHIIKKTKKEAGKSACLFGSIFLLSRIIRKYFSE
jgi:hypothetical protein